MNENELKIAGTVLSLVYSIDPDADVILYGAYARGMQGLIPSVIYW